MRIPGFLLAASLLTACGIEDSGVADGEGDAFTSADGKADGYDLTEAQALAVMRVAGSATVEQLKAAGLSSRVVTNLTAYRAGKDKRVGTTDDQAFDSLVELDAVSYVGPRTLEMLLAHADTSGALDEAALGRHDVSILIPLPTSGDLPWRATTAGRGGALLPRTVFDKIGRSVFSAVDDAQEYDALRVVAVRVDPCFTTALGSACQAQIRLVFQSLSVDRADGTNDGALHALYNLSADQFADVVSRLRALDADANDAYQPLGISPVLRKQGMSGAYAQALGALIAEYCGPTTLARMTFMTRTNSRQSQWQFGGFHVKAFAATGFPAAGPIQIVGTTLTEQVIGNGGFGGGIRYSINPGVAEAAGRDGGDATTMQSLSATQRKALAAWAVKQEAPLLTVPDTTDCASCHIAGHTSRTLEALDAALVTLDRGPRLIAGAEAVGDNLRAFGYFGSDPVISIRTANETPPCFALWRHHEAASATRIAPPRARARRMRRDRPRRRSLARRRGWRGVRRLCPQGRHQ